MGGVKREGACVDTPSSASRLAGTNQDTMMAGSQAFAELNPFEKPS